MNNNVKNIIKNNFEWMKYDFVLNLFLLGTATLVFRLINVHEFIKCLVILILFLKALSFLNMFPIIPINSAGKNHFSWKYLQSLPLRKKDLIMALSISNLIAGMPLVFLIICFYPELNLAISFNLSHVVVNTILFLYLFAQWSVLNLIEWPRVDFQRQSTEHRLVKFFSSTILGVLFITIFIISLCYLKRHDINLIEPLLLILQQMLDTIMSWWSVPILILLMIYLQFTILKIWKNEKLSYKKNIWNPKKEYSIICISLTILFLIFMKVDFNTPYIYEGSLAKAVYEKKYSNVERELKLNPNINLKNDDGMTAMFVAIREGNLEMVKFLESKGASFEGGINNAQHKRFGYDATLFAVESRNLKMLEYVSSKVHKIKEYNKMAGFYPIHLASFLCDSKIVDYLIRNAADVNLKNNKGQTPLMLAAMKSCFSVAVSLLENGANIDLLDNKGKSALSHVGNNNSNDEFRYFLEKKSKKSISDSNVP